MKSFTCNIIHERFKSFTWEICIRQHAHEVKTESYSMTLHAYCMAARVHTCWLFFIYPLFLYSKAKWPKKISQLTSSMRNFRLCWVSHIFLDYKCSLCPINIYMWPLASPSSHSFLLIYWPFVFPLELDFHKSLTNSHLLDKLPYKLLCNDNP